MPRVYPNPKLPKVPLIVKTGWDAADTGAASFVGDGAIVTSAPWTWLKADTITGVAEAGIVSPWSDSSGNGRHATYNGGSVPVFYTARQNNLPGVFFVAGWYTFPSMAAFTAGTVIAVMKVYSEGTANQAQWHLSADPNSFHYPWYLDGNIYDGTGSTVRKTVGNPTPALDTAHIYSVTSAAGAWEARLDGAVLYSTGTNVVGFPAIPYLGRGGPGAQLQAGFTHEFIVWNRALSTVERAAVEASLKEKWATP